jgi:murein DD-endopeptidase MepM/ murein hydrolase activator NlpD
MAALKGTVVYAAAGGRVIYAAYQKGYGNTVLIEHSKQYTTRYAHLDSIRTQTGKTVLGGGIIGTVGDTGYTIKNGRDASHLHFEILDRGKHVNPLPLLPAL